MDKALQELNKIRATKSGKEKKEARASITDPDARITKQSDRGYAPSYNVQLSTDAAAGVIIGVGVSKRPDADELMPAIERIKENVGKTPQQVVADGGYTNWENVVAMNGAGVDFIGSIPDRAAQKAGRFKQRGVEETFRLEHFAYDEQSDTYLCPEGKTLRRHGRNTYTGWLTSCIGRAGKTAHRARIRSSAALVT